jgi:hypothetical protein
MRRGLASKTWRMIGSVKADMRHDRRGIPEEQGSPAHHFGGGLPMLRAYRFRVVPVHRWKPRQI